MTARPEEGHRPGNTCPRPATSPRQICKVFTALAIFIVMATGHVLNKLSTVWLLGNQPGDDDGLMTWYAAMATVILVPEVFALMKVFWHTSFIKSTTARTWPSPVALLAGVAASACEACSYLVFTLEVAPRLPVPVLVPLLSAVFAVSLSHDQWQYYNDDYVAPGAKVNENFTLSDKRREVAVGKKRGEGGSAEGRPGVVGRTWRRLLRTSFAFSGIWSSCAVAAIVAMTTSLPWFQALCLPVTLCLLSLCWHPSVQVYVVRSADGSFGGRWKATCVYTVTRLLVLVLGLNVVMVIRLRQAGFLDTDFFLGLWRGLQGCQTPVILYPLVAQLVTGLLVHLAGFTGASLCMAGLTLTLPCLAATPLAVVISACFCIPSSTALLPALCIPESIGVWCACGLATVTWLAPFIIKGRRLNPSPHALLMPLSELFIQPAWNGVFMEQHQFLSYKWDGFTHTRSAKEQFQKRHRSGSLDSEIAPDTKVFICTTMYREADFEMSRLIQSLSRVSSSKKLSTVYLEAHIFLDNGTQDLHITDFATQLVSILETKIGVVAKDANAYITPYGAQLSWRLPGGMPFFVHLKDSEKVKPKKRWSQVMYMSYVLNFRLQKDNTKEEYPDGPGAARTAVPSRADSNPGSIADSLLVGYASEKEWQKNYVSLSSDPERLQTNSPSPALIRSTLRESKRQLALLCRDTPYCFNGMQIQTQAGSVLTTSTSFSSMQTRTTCQATSSDQGIGQSDDVVSVTSSSSQMDETSGSSSVAASRSSSVRKEEGEVKDECWQDYEGDVSSSNNENSLTFAKARHYADRAGTYFATPRHRHDYVNLPDVEEPPSYENLSFHNRRKSGGHVSRKPQSHSQPYPSASHHQSNQPSNHHHHHHHQSEANPGEGRKPKRPPPRPAKPTRHHRREAKSRDSKTSHGIPIIAQDVGHANPAFDSAAGSNPDGLSASDTSLPSFNSLPTADASPKRQSPDLEQPEITLLPKELVSSGSGSSSLIQTAPRSRKSSIFSMPSAERLVFKELGKGQYDEFPTDNHTYILATDADMEFNDDSVVDLLTLCRYDDRVGGACGRTHPIGQATGPLVWYQKFEYAKDFWMIKSAQNVIGSVMCCPGCFSLYRASAIRDVMADYATPTKQPFDVFIKDTGEDRWMCTLMMLQGWKLEYTAFCDNTTYCPDTLREFMKQRRRWVLSDIANMILVFKNTFQLAQRNDSFSIAYILYLVQMFSIVLLSPSSTVVILAGGLDIVYGIPFELSAPVLGVMTLTYALVCLVGGPKAQTRVTVTMTSLLGIIMLLVVIGGSVFVVQDIFRDIQQGSIAFQEYYLILLLIAALVFAALVHPRETWLMAHGLSYLLGFPAMQILLPVYAVCNIVDQSWGTRDTNESKAPPVSCFSKHRKRYHKSLSRKSQIPAESDPGNPDSMDPEHPVLCPTGSFISMDDGHRAEEYNFWMRMREVALGYDVLPGLSGSKLSDGLRTLRNLCLLILLLLNTLWLVILSVLYYHADMNLAKLNIYGLIAGAVYGLVLLVQVIGMTLHRTQAVFSRFARRVFGPDRPVWIQPRFGL